jgi:hypothetical protein
VAGTLSLPLYQVVSCNDGRFCRLMTSLGTTKSSSRGNSQTKSKFSFLLVSRRKSERVM